MFAICPRCGSTAQHLKIDVEKSNVLRALQQEGASSQSGWGCAAWLGLLTFGIPLSIHGLTRLANFPRRMEWEKQRASETERCSRYTCLECSLIWYANEWEALRLKSEAEGHNG